jgi:hypothetical protein
VLSRNHAVAIAPQIFLATFLEVEVEQQNRTQH